MSDDATAPDDQAVVDDGLDPPQRARAERDAPHSALAVTDEHAIVAVAGELRELADLAELVEPEVGPRARRDLDDRERGRLLEPDDDPRAERRDPGDPPGQLVGHHGRHREGRHVLPLEIEATQVCVDEDDPGAVPGRRGRAADACDLDDAVAISTVALRLPGQLDLRAGRLEPIDPVERGRVQMTSVAAQPSQGRIGSGLQHERDRRAAALGP
jgi:hypothetical protein